MPLGKLPIWKDATWEIVTCKVSLGIMPLGKYLTPFYQNVTKNDNDGDNQGTNARKVISAVYAFFVLQCIVFWRKSKHKTDVTAWLGIHFYKNNLWNILVKRNYYVNYQNIKIKSFYPPRILDEHVCIYSIVHKFRPERTGFNMYAEIYATAITFPCIITLVEPIL